MKPKSLSTKSIKEASTWMARLWADNVTDDDQAAFERWQHQHPDNQYAWQQLLQLQQTFKKLPSSEASQRVLASNPSIKRRLLFGATISLGVAGLIARHYPLQQPINTKEYSTATGQIKHLRLDDGTKLVLNTSTQLYISINNQLRQLNLQKGEVMITTTPNVIPLTVQSHEGYIKPLGTRFSVHQQNQQTEVCVYKGRVAIQPKMAVTAKEIKAGTSSVFTTTLTQEPYKNLQNNDTWTQQLLVATRMPLLTFINELARHRRGILRIDPQLSDLKVTGVFSLNNTDQALYNLTQILPLKLHYLTHYWVNITPREKPD